MQLVCYNNNLIRQICTATIMKNGSAIMRIGIFFCLISIAVSVGCQYFTQSSCTSVGCSWSNSTCTTGSGTCQGGWTYSSSIQECVQCSTLKDNNCSQICTRYFYSPNSNTCQSCSNINNNCLTCTATQCNSCATGFSVDPEHTAECLIDTCKIRFCVTCESNSTCYLCQTGYTPALSGSVCSASACSIANCLYCVESNSCVRCQTDYQLSQSGTSCTAICTDVNCQSCSSPSLCTTCLSGYSFNSNTGSCQLLCTVNFCSTCDLSTTCTSCVSGYIVNNAYTLCNPDCIDDNCDTCTTASNCVKCNLGYSLANGACSKAMCYIENCQTCLNADSCQACDSISTITSNKTSCTQNCLTIVTNCKTCESNTTCTACKAGYQLSSDAKSCNVACQISNCKTCLTSTLCSNCLDGYIISNGGASCIFNCGILNCVSCKSSTTCQQCSSLYALSTSAKSCTLTCSPGFYLNSANTTNPCQSCSTAKSNCQACTVLGSSSVVVCSKCQDLYFITANGDCTLCSSKISNCLLCNDPNNCITCMTGFNLVSLNGAFGCVLPYTCNVANCQLCSSTDPLVCTQCNSAYYLTDDTNKTCSLIICLDTQYYDSTTLSCTCPVGTFLINRKCSYCNLDNCATCNSGGCLVCKSQYYPNQGKCSKCSNNCVNCTSGTSCLECDYGYTLQSNGNCKKADDRYGSTSVGETTTQAVCPPGCAKCTYYQGSIFCTVAKDGYAIDPTGNVIKCIDDCLTCINTDYTICASCYGASVITNGACTGCSDPFALSCPYNYKYSTSCIINYSPINGVCRKCAANCLTCGQAGASKCDDNGCSSGYVKLVDTSNCTKCFLSCATCSANNPSTCLSCGTSNYLSNSSICASCPSACLTCSSSSVCTSCPQGFTLDSQWCYTTIGKPCSSQSKSTCTSCFLGYILTNGECKIDNTCNGTLSCSNCDKGFYLRSKQCFPCATDITTCDYCKPLSPSDCLFCTSGYYLQMSGIICKACSSAQTGCSVCESAQKCTAAIDGYYLQVDIYNAYTGKAEKCKDVCATCSSYDTCNTCKTDYLKIGTTCYYYQYVLSKFVLNSAEGSSQWFNSNNTNEQNLVNSYLKLNQIYSSLANMSDITDKQRLILTNLQLGSIVVGAIMASDPSLDFTTFSNNIANNANEIPDFTVVSSSLIVNGATSTSSANLGLILGITVPLLVLLAVIIIFIKIYLGDSDEKSTQETEKEIQQIQM